METYTFNDLYEEIKQQEANNPKDKEVQAFYEYLGKPFPEIVGLDEK